MWRFSGFHGIDLHPSEIRGYLRFELQQINLENWNWSQDSPFEWNLNASYAIHSNRIYVFEYKCVCDTEKVLAIICL